MVVTDGTSTLEEKNSEDSIDESSVSIETPKSDEYDIVKVFQSIKHKTAVYENGLVLGVHTCGIPGKRGVHLDLAYVVDLRRASFGKTTIAMQSGLIETLNRDIESVLRDVDLDENLIEVSKRTTRGRVEFMMLCANPNHPGSLIHITRTVYVIVNDVRPSTDLSWLTEPSRILNAEDFLLARRSDMRSFLSEMQTRVFLEKWDAFNESMKEGWFGLLALSFSIIGLVSLIGAVLITASSLIMPLVAASAGAFVGAWLMRNSRMKMSDFHEMLESERVKTNKVGDGYRLDQSISLNESKLQLQRDLGFVVSPLMAAVAGSIGIGDYEGAVTSSCLVLDECVRYSQVDSESMGDEGLSKFIGLFNNLEVEVDEAELSLSYVGLSNHISSSLTEDEIIAHSTALANALYDSGILKPSVKNRIDDLMNSRAMKENLRFLDSVIVDEDLTEPPEKDWIYEELLDGELAPQKHDMPIIETVTFPEEAIVCDEAKSKAIADQLDDLSEAIRASSSAFEMEATASDVINARSEKINSLTVLDGQSDSDDGDEPTE
ncbi:MAG: hypothetical protein P1Q69_02255 [Candidatus Thorarchaeota archaeon]|nr:hypothetical protein [Candidatus Thorarchaeota archaeon]